MVFLLTKSKASISDEALYGGGHVLDMILYEEKCASMARKNIKNTATQENK